MLLNTAGHNTEMRTPQTINPLIEYLDDHDDIYRPIRSYPYYPSRNRPSLISSKYKQKEERRRILRISLSKLKKIDDPEVSLCRSVLINNTTKWLQQETRNEKLQKQQLHYPRRYSNENNCLNIKTEFLKNEKPLDKIMFLTPEDDKITEMITDNDFHTRLEEEINHVNVNDNNNTSTITCSVEESCATVLPVPNHKQESCLLARKRTFDEIEEYDMHDVLKQFYLPSTPRMLTGIDDDEDVNTTDDNALTKRLKSDDQISTNNKENTDLICHTTYSNSSRDVTSFLSDQLALSRHSNSSVVESDSNSFSCGHASMLCELQSNNFYQNLISSLET